MMRGLLEKRLVGLDYLRAVTMLLQRIRSTHPTVGLYEAADLQWWWAQNPRSTDDLAQLFWFDHLGRPEAAAIMTSSGDRVQFDPLFMLDVSASTVEHVMSRGLIYAGRCQFETVTIEVDALDVVLRDVLLTRGFGVTEGGIIETWLEADACPEMSSLSEGYCLATRLDTMDRPHHMVNAKRGHPDREKRLCQTSLYRPDLDLVVDDSHGNVAASGLFWFDPETRTGLVEPMRTEVEHQRRGLARHILTVGINRLVTCGATRIKICFEPDNPASKHLYLSAGFRPDRQTVVLQGPTIKRAATEES